MSSHPGTILCLDTSAGTAVALVTPAGIARRSHANPRGHAESLAPLIADLTDLTGVEAIAVGTGPAPFTGLRVGIATARTLGAARDLPVYGVSVLDAIARQAFDTDPSCPRVTVVTDARRREVYSATFAPRGEHDVECLTGPDVLAPAALVERLTPEDVVVGAVHLMDPAVQARPLDLDVATLARLVRARLAAGVQLPTNPLYLREPDIHR
ncbi:MAG: tRNA (adenosine(37)-N6)-threonylcarbamoyltransferase complex dimerization subunit type 1 TsaB [Bowdeniella nasicola]|nr:tRNA (adenosine(37)-N6)-threonylcarbamoyltransferase complex dimerization subunit type 1 TsaB [Bowdeniella nasicola]